MLEGLLLLAISSHDGTPVQGCADPTALEFAYSRGLELGRLAGCAPIPGSKTMITAFDRSERSAGAVEVWLHSGDIAIASYVIEGPEWFINGYLRRIDVGEFPDLLRPGGTAISVTLETSLNSWDPERNVWVFVQSGDTLVPVLSEFQVYSFNGQIGHTSCSGENLKVEVDLSAGSSAHSGFNNIVATSRETTSRGEMRGDNCLISTTPVRTTQTILEYREGSYRVVGGES